MPKTPSFTTPTTLTRGFENDGFEVGGWIEITGTFRPWHVRLWEWLKHDVLRRTRPAPQRWRVVSIAGSELTAQKEGA
jgi:hypothetical protein